MLLFRSGHRVRSALIPPPDVLPFEPQSTYTRCLFNRDYCDNSDMMISLLYIIINNYFIMFLHLRDVF